MVKVVDGDDMRRCVILLFFFFFKQKTAYEMQRGLVGSEMCIRDSINAEYMGITKTAKVVGGTAYLLCIAIYSWNHCRANNLMFITNELTKAGNTLRIFNILALIFVVLFFLVTVTDLVLSFFNIHIIVNLELIGMLLQFLVICIVSLVVFCCINFVRLYSPKKFQKYKAFNIFVCFYFLMTSMIALGIYLMHCLFINFNSWQYLLVSVLSLIVDLAPCLVLLHLWFRSDLFPGKNLEDYFETSETI
eukprot:TRINITY_DN570_c0_g1_i1.p1 TRINITY_DN570_c0_g1~~TRINITY_DN570_c0_g1_i1.p1  ORF type:complete len:247 (-),score=40.62 TRINITY_DN570_c0_g1_i1:53-793(-)